MITKDFAGKVGDVQFFALGALAGYMAVAHQHPMWAAVVVFGLGVVSLIVSKDWS